uniref:Uncharacterized protein n=1 Tax=Plectus sambesii TaxID=2011161 RepID=A0A914VV94_9BILA
MRAGGPDDERRPCGTALSVADDDASSSVPDASSGRLEAPKTSTDRGASALCDTIIKWGYQSWRCSILRTTTSERPPPPRGRDTGPSLSPSVGRWGRAGQPTTPANLVQDEK